MFDVEVDYFDTRYLKNRVYFYLCTPLTELQIWEVMLAALKNMT